MPSSQASCVLSAVDPISAFFSESIRLAKVSLNGSFALVPPNRSTIPRLPRAKNDSHPFAALITWPSSSPYLTECACGLLVLLNFSVPRILKDAKQVTRRSSSLRSPPSKPFFPASQHITQALPSLTARCPPACFILKLRHHHILAFNFIPAPCPNISYTVAYFCNSFELSFLKLLCSIQSPPRRLFPILSRIFCKHEA